MKRRNFIHNAAVGAVYIIGSTLISCKKEDFRTESPFADAGLETKVRQLVQRSGQKYDKIFLVNNKSESANPRVGRSFHPKKILDFNVVGFIVLDRSKMNFYTKENSEEVFMIKMLDVPKKISVPVGSRRLEKSSLSFHYIEERSSVENLSIKTLAI